MQPAVFLLLVMNSIKASFFHPCHYSLRFEASNIPE